MIYSNLDYIRAHRYLYYIETNPIISDYEYDIWGRDNCEEDYKGGSDNPKDYTLTQIKLSQLIKSKQLTPLTS